MGGIKAYIVDKNGNPLLVNGEGEITVSVHSHPPIDEKKESVPFRQYFTDDGTSTGSNDMIVDGSSTAVDFYIKASQDCDIYIKTITVEIGDSGSPNLNLFGTLSALTNGVLWCHSTQAEGLYVLHDGIKTNKEFIRTGIRTGAVGTGSDSYLADVSGGATTKSYLPVIDISATFGLPWGLRLKKGSEDKLVFTIQDAMAGLDVFNAIGYGLRI